MGETKGIKIGREEGKAKYTMPNPSPRSLPPEMPEDEKPYLYDVDTEAKATPKGNPILFSTVFAVMTHVPIDPPTNPLTMLGGN